MNEPAVLSQAMVNLNNFVSQYETLKDIIPRTADFFVFLYPVFLVVRYSIGIYRKNNVHKIGSLYVLTAATTTIILNLFIQFFVDKSRPELAIHAKENLFLPHLPTKPFPSDHAGISAAIGVAILLWGIKTKNNILIIFGYTFIDICIIMSISRVAAGIHRFTDIIAGIILGGIVAIVLLYSPTLQRRQENLFTRLINIEEKVFSLFKTS